jgi:hypothetical protein
MGHQGLQVTESAKVRQVDLMPGTAHKPQAAGLLMPDLRHVLSMPSLRKLPAHREPQSIQERNLTAFLGFSTEASAGSVRD